MKKIILFIACITAFTANAQFTKLLDFSGIANGGGAYGSLFSEGSFLYGLTGGGGTHGKGTIFKIKPDGTGYLKLFDFSGIADGNYPWGDLISDGTYLYGTTELGGINNNGVIFRIMPDGTNFSKLYDFSGTPDGKWPLCSLIYDGTYLYGTASQGGVSNMGTIFKLKTDGTGFIKLFDFTGPANGMNPMSSLIFNDSAIYGMTRNGGAYGTYGDGVIFRIMPDGSGFTNLYNFPGGAGGYNPDGYLISDGTFFYGTTNNGGIYSYGNIFKIKPDGSSYSDLFDFFPATDGSNPYGSLASDGTHFYGMTYLGGANNKGTFYSVMPDGSGFSVLVDFSGTANGALSYNTPMFDGTSVFGMVDEGGLYNGGVLFKFDPVITTGSIENSTDPAFEIFPNPTNGILNLALPSCERKNVTVNVYNTIGALVYSNFFSDGPGIIDLSGQPDGAYFLTIVSDHTMIKTRKVIKY